MIATPAQTRIDGRHLLMQDKPWPRDQKLLLPYQQEVTSDHSRIVVAEKSRRIGGTEGEAFRAAFEGTFGLPGGATPMNVWFSSADESAAREFMDRVKHWSRALGKIVESVTGEEIIDGKKFNIFTADMPAGNKIVAMASSPKGFRSKGGHVILDEFAHHEQAKAMWKAAYPVITWGGTIRVLSTHNGENTEFNRLVQMGKRAKAGAPNHGDYPVSLHSIDIHRAIEEGLVERINLVSGSSFTREEFLADLRAGMTQEDWEEEYECKPASEANSFFPFDQLRSLPSSPVVPTSSIPAFLGSVRSRLLFHGASALFAGCDIGRVNDRFVLAARAQVGGMLRLVGLLIFTDRPFADMSHAVNSLMGDDFALGDQGVPSGDTIRVRRLCMDATGLGMQIAEQSVGVFRTRVEAVTFTAAVKEDMATTARARVEEKTIDLPADDAVLRAWNGIRCETTSAGNRRYGGERGKDGHQDIFWADGGLCLHAAKTGKSAGGWVGGASV